MPPYRGGGQLSSRGARAPPPGTVWRGMANGTYLVLAFVDHVILGTTYETPPWWESPQSVRSTSKFDLISVFEHILVFIQSFDDRPHQDFATASYCHYTHNVNMSSYLSGFQIQSSSE